MRYIINTSLKRKQVGGLVITTALFMLLLTLTASLYTAKVKVLDIRMASNEIRAQQAFSQAEAGLQHAMSHLKVNRDFVGTLTQVTDDMDFNVDVATCAPVQDPAGTPACATPKKGQMAILTSTGTSDNGNAIRVLEQKVLIHSVISTVADSALTVSGGVNLSGNIIVGANPNGGGEGVPLSVWTDDLVDLGIAAATCGLEEYDNNECGTFSYSKKGNEGSDLFEDTKVSAGGTFPDDVFEYNFGVPAAEYQSVKDLATEVLADCDSLGESSTGFFWVTGSCNLGAKVGTADAPLLLIVEDADLTVNGNTEVFGMLFSFSKDPLNPGGDVKITGTATVYGAMGSDHPIDISSGTFNMRYDASVLEKIATGDAFTQVSVVPGSWKDF